MEILDKLKTLKDEKYLDFIAKLVPNIPKKNIIGIKKPILEKFEKNLTEQDKIKFLNTLPHTYLEENLLHGIIISNIKNFEEKLTYFENFLPYVDNWAVCDMIKLGKPNLNNKEIIYNKCKEWILSNDEYTIRFGIVTFLSYFLDKYFKEEILYLISKINFDSYYVNMAKAWFYSFALIKQYDKTISIFENKTLSKFVHNKSLQKARESLRIDKETKDYLNLLKIK
ncbi:MAG: DNA alkylation repair protein [Clostridia bacterium]|nr:DNA alkylation repair protein [Clostridia bacterium]